MNGSLSNLLLLSSQWLDVGSGTVADGIQLERLAHLMIHSGGTVLNTELSAGMSATVSSGGVLSGVALNDRGTLILSTGARVYDLDYYSNTSNSLRITGYDVTVSGMTIHSGGKAVFNNNLFRAENVTLKVGGCLGGFSFDEEQHIDVVSRRHTFHLHRYPQNSPRFCTYLLFQAQERCHKAENRQHLCLPGYIRDFRLRCI